MKLLEFRFRFELELDLFVTVIFSEYMYQRYSKIKMRKHPLLYLQNTRQTSLRQKTKKVAK